MVTVKLEKEQVQQRSLNVESMLMVRRRGEGRGEEEKGGEGRGGKGRGGRGGEGCDKQYWVVARLTVLMPFGYIVAAYLMNIHIFYPYQSGITHTFGGVSFDVLRLCTQCVCSSLSAPC